MIISRAQVQNILKIYSKDNLNKMEPKQAGKTTEKKDDLTISEESRIKQKAMQVIKQTEDIRQDKVDYLKQEIGSGTYTVTDDEVAEKMIYRAIVDHLI